VGREGCSYLLTLDQLKVLASNYDSLLFLDQLFSTGY
jgi:hypothetical protein